MPEQLSPPSRQYLDAIVGRGYEPVAAHIHEQLNQLEVEQPVHSEVEGESFVPMVERIGVWDAQQPIAHQVLENITRVSNVAHEMLVTEDILQGTNHAADHEQVWQRATGLLQEYAIEKLQQSREQPDSPDMKALAEESLIVLLSIKTIEITHPYKEKVAVAEDVSIDPIETVRRLGFERELIDAAKISQEHGLVARVSSAQGDRFLGVWEVVNRGGVADQDLDIAKKDDHIEGHYGEEGTVYELEKPLLIKGDLKPMSTEKFTGRNGVVVDLPVLAEFGIDKIPDKMILTYNDRASEDGPAEGYMLVSTRQGLDGRLQVRDTKSLNFEADQIPQMSLQEGEHELNVRAEKGKPGDEFSWRLTGFSWDFSGSKEKSERVVARIASGQETTRKGRTFEERFANRRHRKERLRNFANGAFRAAVGLVALKAMVDSGGIIDQIGEKFNDAQTVVYETIQAPEHIQLDPNSIWLDGITYADAPSGSLEEDQTRDDAYYESEVTARNDVAGIMENLDGHDYNHVKQEAGAYIAEHSDQLLDSSQMRQYSEQIEKATTNDDVMKALQGFASFYSLHAEFMTSKDEYLSAFDPANNIGEVKKTAQDIVTSLGWLPKDIVASAKLKTIMIGNPSTDLMGRSVQGDYNAYQEAITVPLEASPIMREWMNIGAYTQSSDVSFSGTFLHEFGHALDAAGTISEVLVSPNEEQSLGLPTILEQTFWNGIVKRPQVISAYSRTNSAEMTAEVVSGVLSQRSDGMAHPDEWRRYNSPANKEMLKMLYSLDLKFPGFAAYVVAHNEHLMQGQSINDFPMVDPS